MPYISAMVGINKDEQIAWVDAINPEAIQIVSMFKDEALAVFPDKVVFEFAEFNELMQCLTEHGLRAIATEWSY